MVSLTWICEAWRSIVIIWSAPAVDNMLATSLAEIGARLWNTEHKLLQEIKAASVTVVQVALKTSEGNNQMCYSSH